MEFVIICIVACLLFMWAQDSTKDWGVGFLSGIMGLFAMFAAAAAFWQAMVIAVGS